MQNSRKSFWGHPMFAKYSELLNECKAIKYAAYRMAAKLHLLQQILCMENARLGIISGVFDRHHLSSTENDVELEYADLEAVLYDIYFAVQKESHSNIDVDKCTASMINFLLHVYDVPQKNTVAVISAKICLAVLCSSRLQDKYRYFFQQFADHNYCISQKRFTVMLNNITKISEFLSESHTFGTHLVPSTVDNTCKNWHGSLGMMEDQFINWLREEPQILAWLSTLYRLQAAEQVNHAVKCSVCKMFPIKGLRYHCLSCLRYDQCQSCFFVGKLSKRHKLTHPMEEHCSEMSLKESTITFLRILKNRLCGTRTVTRMTYLPSETLANTDGESGQVNYDSYVDDVALLTHTLVHGKRVAKEIQPYTELQSIICHLENDNRQLQQDIEILLEQNGSSQVGECIQGHRALVEAQVKRLKELKRHLLQVCAPAGLEPSHLESTPVLPAALRNGRRGMISAAALDQISPIMRQEDETRISMEYKKLQTTPVMKSRCSNADVDQSSQLPSLVDYSSGDISSWVGNGDTIDSPVCASGLTAWLQEAQPPSEKKLRELHDDLDQILDRLQTMLSNNFSVDDSFSGRDNAHLQQTTAEIEDLLAGLVEGVESRRKHSARQDNIPELPS